VRKAAAKGRRVRLGVDAEHQHLRRQDEAYKQSVLPPPVTRRVAVEAGVRATWWQLRRPAGPEIVGIDHFGASAPAKDLFKAYGFTPSMWSRRSSLRSS
jgi:transketolase